MMRTNRSLPARAFRALMAFFTAWCLMCPAIEPLMAEALSPEASLPMVCADDPVFPGDAASPEMTRIPADTSQSAALFACGCQSCYAPTPVELSFVLPAFLTAAPEWTEPVTLSGVDRKPLVPPPQATPQVM